jgi:aminomethyltransferase
MADVALKTLPLDGLHRAAGAKFGGFAGYDMPITYPDGLMAEHAWTRTKAGLFDVSHMGPCFIGLPKGHGLEPEAAHAAIAAQIERLVPSDILGLKPGQVRYTTLLNAQGGVIDDLMVARPSEPEAQGDLYVVVNAGGKVNDWAVMAAAFDPEIRIVRADDRALLALQGPGAEAALARIIPGAAAMKFMTYARLEAPGFGRLTVSRSGYTGEDGFEILVKADAAEGFAAALLGDEAVRWVGLGARDSLRLEAGLCLYGHDLDETISPIEADLAWIIQKRRRQAADFPGAERILAELRDDATHSPTLTRKRVGIRPVGRAPAREGVEIHSYGDKIGVVTSGGFSPTLQAPISMGYAPPAFARAGMTLDLVIRGQKHLAEVVDLPFVPHRYKKG